MSQATDQITGDEVLYRRVRAGRHHYTVDADEKVHFEPSAFSESTYRPSVDRAKLRNYDPILTKVEPSDGVTSVVADDVRASKPLPQLNKKGNPIPGQVFGVDVEPVKLPDNHAHAEIFLHPECHSAGVFRRLCMRLAYLAEERQWEAAPEGHS